MTLNREKAQGEERMSSITLRAFGGNSLHRQEGKYTVVGFVAGGGAVISARKGTACCVAPGRTGIGTTRRKGRRHGTPSRNRRRRVASESRFRNTVKLGPWELEVEVEQTALKYCTRTQVTYTLQLNTVVTPPERVLNLVL